MTSMPASRTEGIESTSQPPNRPSKYRADIDGLRAVAVMLVLLFHLKFHLLRGGFVGVDIFFVISGYLITQHVYQEVDAGKFSIASFYERRIRRIFPAMAGMLVAATILAYVLLLPEELVGYAKSLVAAVLSYSNFYFWLSSNYFSGGDKPLLHTWSLAVEEQFYLVLPPLLLILRNASVRIRTVAIASISVVSFILSATLIFRYPEATFYLLPTRAWELLLGGMLGMGMIRFPQKRWSKQLFGIAGFALIAVSAVVYTTKMPFPRSACAGSVRWRPYDHRSGWSAGYSHGPVSFHEADGLCGVDFLLSLPLARSNHLLPTMHHVLRFWANSSENSPISFRRPGGHR